MLNQAALRAERTDNSWDDAFLEAIKKPQFGVWVIGISFAIDSMQLEGQAEIFSLTDEIRDVAVVWLMIWFAVNFTENVEKSYVEGKHKHTVDATTATAVGKLLRASIIITGVLMLLQAFGFSISGVLALGGVGGIAIGFAAVAAGQFFWRADDISGSTVFCWRLDSISRPRLGGYGRIHWLAVTQIRTFDQRPLYVPNSVFTEVSVENPSRMNNRRIYETFGIRYDDLSRMPGIVDDVHNMLLAHEDIAQERTLMVNFVTFGDSTLDFFVYTFTKTTDWATFHKVKQDVLLKIADIVAAWCGFAFPTQTLQLETPEALAQMAQAQGENREQTAKLSTDV